MLSSISLTLIKERKSFVNKTIKEKSVLRHKIADMSCQENKKEQTD